MASMAETRLTNRLTIGLWNPQTFVKTKRYVEPNVSHYNAIKAPTLQSMTVIDSVGLSVQLRHSFGLKAHFSATE